MNDELENAKKKAEEYIKDNSKLINVIRGTNLDFHVSN
ncbi:hypothetical protein BMS3Abin06_01598 [bacterium BMS3Abin06]|nr:hypothetical protein BMS3Abin06_01598 [bacterium BMS3Abin06]